MIIPNYRNGSIVNLMSSIGKTFGKKVKYGELKALNSSELKEYKNIVLIVIDGLGYNYINKFGEGTFLKNNLKGKMSSVFPPTTAAAIPTFMTGVAPKQHSFTGWDMYLKEIGCVSSILPFIPAFGGESLEKSDYNIKDLIDADGFYHDLKANSTIIIKKGLEDSSFTKSLTKEANVISYSTAQGFFSQITKTINKSNKNRKKNFVYCYWDSFDAICHGCGSESPEAIMDFLILDNMIEDFTFRLLKNKKKNRSKSKTKIILTADHGFMDTEDCLFIDEHPKFQECLTLPLTGEPRTAYCYVKPSKAKFFEKYVKTKLKKYCTIHKSEDLLKKGLFGLYKESNLIHDRIGDYVLIMKPGVIIKDSTFSSSVIIGNHGGMSEDEIFVPIITFDI